MKKLLSSLFLSLLIGLFSLNTAFAEIMLFVGDGCPHCATVEKYMAENNIAGRLPVTVYEVWHNMQNRSLYLQKAKDVGYQGSGVPLLVDGGYFTVGSDPIISYFQKLIDAQNAAASEKLKEDAKPVTPPVKVEPKEEPKEEVLPIEQPEQIEEQSPQTTTVVLYTIGGFLGGLLLVFLITLAIRKR